MSTNLSHKVHDRFPFLKRQNTMSVASWQKSRKVGNEIFKSFLKVPNPKLQFLLSVIDTLRLPREDAIYLQAINEIVRQAEISTAYGEEAKVFTSEQLREHRRT